MGIVIKRRDLQTSLTRKTRDVCCITVVCDDTDVFIILVHHYAVLQRLELLSWRILASPERKVHDTQETAKKHAAIAYQLY